MTEPLLELGNVTKEFDVNEGIVPRLLGNTETLRAVDSISLGVAAGETVGLVGESGAGKSTVGNLIVRLHEPTDGSVRYRGEDVHDLSGAELKEYRRSVQMIFQDPESSLDPRYTVGETIAEPLAIHTDLTADEREARVAELLRMVDLEPAFVDRYPHELSGGQVQRVSLATALAVDPDLIVLDEPVSALDVSVQANVLNLLSRLQEEQNLTYLLISHDLGVVRHIADRVAVMYLGEIVESAETETLFETPLHPYTEGLLESLPDFDFDDDAPEAVEGEIPSPINPPDGCAFHTRCRYATDRCETDEPPLETVRSDRLTACHHWEKLTDQHTPVKGQGVESQTD